MRTPTSTYRLQIRAGFDLHEAARRLPYLHDLGVDWVYLSPILAAEPGSDHGYDVVAHDQVDVARGGREGLAALAAEARRLDMGVLVDIVPNHMGVATPEHNRGWWSLLADGPESAHAAAFDVDWELGEGRVRLPVLGDGGRDDLTLRLPDEPAHYELMHWTRADHDLNYRRFFAVNSLAGVRVEERAVFDASHVEIGRWFGEGLVDGLRIDHPDGLRDPARYLTDLAELTGGAYVLVEKILALRDASSLGSSGTTLRDASSLGSSGTTLRDASSLSSSGTTLRDASSLSSSPTAVGEQLPDDWACAGTTGYDALGWIDRVLTDPDGIAALPGPSIDYDELVHDLKRDVADDLLGSEIRRVARELAPVAEEPETPRTARGPHSSAGLETLASASSSTTEGTASASSSTSEATVDALAEIAACFPVYRSYLPHGREHLEHAVAEARRRRPDLTTTLDAVAPVLADATHPAALRFQQTTGAVMAKGVEDSAFYRYPRLTSLTEVGGEPSITAMTPAQFHATMAHRQEHWPHAMTALSTHDTKRGEDVRARIAVLAEVPQVWSRAFAELQRLTPLPESAALVLWQAVLGAWDDDDTTLRDRLRAYAPKAMREAGEHTTWTSPDADFEARVRGAVDAAFDDADVRAVLDGLRAVVADPGRSNALAAKLIALTMPGVPDVYQGSELWELSLVDPDNRRPVDFDLRARLISDPALPHPARTKLTLTAAALRLRRDRSELFTRYDAVAATGGAAEHAVAFDRGGAIAVATRLPVGLAARGGWGRTRLDLPSGRWRDVLTGAETDGALGDLLAVHPVALLIREDR
ncbi:alpha-amylase family glycosyl hydrolase [Nocardioides sp. R-C-SC26]|uniref:alpha-amylase family glycosyl hydrolase n=1 Tax=Nocardioides sp. R-C-SC26 TaxID=2870414 RepID=UPI001E51AE9F|nr:alpha-amylase family glycosyl hydrolase [Nocardioides sp. R-C-SC26]